MINTNCFRFLEKCSFVDHINRRALIIKYKCAYCKQQEELSFYNPCAFLLHIHKHFIDAKCSNLDLDHIGFQTLPVGLSGFLPHPDVKLLYADKEDFLLKDKNMAPIFFAPFSVIKGSNIIQLKATILLFETEPKSGIYLELKQLSTNIPHFIFIPRKSLQSDSSKLRHEFSTISRMELIETSFKTSMILPGGLKKCPECDAAIPSLMPHFEGYDEPNDLRCHKCIICNHIVKSKCALAAHKRIHLEAPPYVCPDCGIQLADFKQLLLHAHKVCLHLQKQLRYKCQSLTCTRTFVSLTTYKAHFSTHISSFYMCPICSIKFKTADRAKLHMDVHGLNLKGLMNKMSVCNICLKNIEDVVNHAAYHLSDDSYMYVYRCRYCRGYFKSPKSYFAHEKLCSRKLMSNAVLHHINLLVPQQCMYCKTIYKLSYSNNILISCANCNDVIERVCILCEKVLPTEKLIEHLLKSECSYINPVVKIERMSYQKLKFYLNDNTDINEDDERKDKLLTKRKNINISPLISNKKIAYDYRIAEDNHVTKDNCVIEESHLAEEDRVSEENTLVVNHHVTENGDVAADQRLTEYPNIESVSFNKIYSCSLCDYTGEIKNKFHEHIITHRNISTAYQCMECGECFVVKPSLAKHLLHCHHINDIDLYLKENNCYDANAVKELTDHILLGATKTQLKENQCSVCFKQFNHDFELKKHIRVHGRAFLIYNSK